jgi:hypothetical protein
LTSLIEGWSPSRTASRCSLSYPLYCGVGEVNVLRLHLLREEDNCTNELKLFVLSFKFKYSELTFHILYNIIYLLYLHPEIQISN